MGGHEAGPERPPARKRVLLLVVVTRGGGRTRGGGGASGFHALEPSRTHRRRPAHLALFRLSHRSCAFLGPQSHTSHVRAGQRGGGG